MPFVVALFVAWRARKMGYNSISWFLVSFLANPLVALGFLAALPNRTIRKKRREDMELLEKQLAQKGLLVEKNQSPPLPRYTIGDRTTIGELSDAGLDIIYSVTGSLSPKGRSPDREVVKKEQEVEPAEPSPREAQPTESPRRELSRNKKFAIGCGIVASLLLCLCLCACLLIATFLFYFSRESENIFVEAEYPWVVQEGDEFEFVLNIHNTGGTAITTGDIDLDEMFGGSILDGAIVVRTDPPMERDYSLPGVKSFKYNRIIPSGESRQVTFFLKAITPGEFGGSIAVYTGDIAYRIDAAITITQK
jgi:hypothetical protein